LIHSVSQSVIIIIIIMPTSSSFDKQIEETIPALFYMFAGSDDSQQSADVNNVTTFTLPDPAGKAGGACTSALLQTLYRDEEDTTIDLSWTETLAAMAEKIKEIGLPQTPTLSSSRMININDTLRIVPDDFDPAVNTKRAMLIGINYTGEAGALTGCHNDVRNMKDFLIAVCGFEREQMLILMDDDKHHVPTKEMIMDGFRKLVELSEEGDVIFIQFSGM
jgi:metacaspase-1